MRNEALLTLSVRQLPLVVKQRRDLKYVPRGIALNDGDIQLYLVIDFVKLYNGSSWPCAAFVLGLAHGTEQERGVGHVNAVEAQANPDLD